MITHRESSAPVATPTTLVFFEHTATVVFDDPGAAEVVLRHSTSFDHKSYGRKVFTVKVHSVLKSPASTS